MKPTLNLIAAALLIAALPTYGATQDAGAKRSVRVLTPATPGGPGDVQIRILLPKLSESLGQTLIVENRASNNGIVAMEITAKATPDGHTLAVGNSGTHSINPSLYRKLPYDPLRDFIAVTQFSTTGMMVAANPRLPGTSIQDLASYARNNPGKMNVAIAGATGELAGNALWSQLRVKMNERELQGQRAFDARDSLRRSGPRSAHAARNTEPRAFGQAESLRRDEQGTLAGDAGGAHARRAGRDRL